MKKALNYPGPLRPVVSSLLALSILLALSGAQGASASDRDSTCQDVPSEGRVTMHCRIEMSDGKSLAATVILPGREKAFPIILAMTPYGRPKSTGQPAGTSLKLSHGYGFVIVDVRGTGGSTGSLCVFCPREQQDIYEIIDWIAEQRAWSNGKVGMTGGSYLGINGLLGAATQHPALKVVVALHAYSDMYRDAVWQNGLFNTGLAPQWNTWQSILGTTGQTSNMSDRPGATELADPVAQDPTIATDRTENATFIDARAREYDGPFYTERSIYPRYDHIRIPVISVGGWLDAFSRGTVRNFQGVASEEKRLLMQPFGHHDGGSLSGLVDFEPLSPHIGKESDTGDDAYGQAYALYRETIHDAFDRYLLGDETHSWHAHEKVDDWREEFMDGIDLDAPVTYFDMGYSGRDGWRTAVAWPPAGSELKTFYLSGEDTADATSPERGSLTNDGSLRTEVPRPDGGSDRYVYDPSQGVTETFSKWGEIAATPQVRAGERGEEVRALTYTTPPMEEPLELAGPIELRFFATTTAKDMDWVVKVSDVSPSGGCTHLQPEQDQPLGNSCLMTSGYLRASHREVDEARSEPAEPWIANLGPAEVPNGALDKKPVEYRVDVWPTAWTIKPGHRLRVTIMSSDVPNHEPSPYPGVNEIFHSDKYQSRLIVTHVPEVVSSPTDLTIPEDLASGQYSDVATFAARLVDESGSPLPDQELTFDLTTADGTRSLWGTTDGDGVARVHTTLVERPGVAQLDVRYPGSDRHEASAATMAYAIQKEDAAFALDVMGRGANRQLLATLSDSDSGAPISGRPIEFSADGDPVCRGSTTDAAGQVTCDLPPRYHGGSHRFTADFREDAWYLAVTATTEG